MREDNIFQFGGQVSGESFFGRNQLLAELTRDTRKSSGLRSIAIVGQKHVGKTSLINQLSEREFVKCPDVIVISANVQVSNSANTFWYTVVELTEQKISQRGVVDERIQKAFADISKLPLEDSRWFSKMSSNLQAIMARLKELGYRVIMILDEFDTARKIFKLEPAGLGLIRNLATESHLATTVITISRRRLYQIEKVADEGGSKLEQSFYTKYIRPFDELDMESYYDALAEYYIFPDKEMEQELNLLAGRQPYLLCLYANRLVEEKLSGNEPAAVTVRKIRDAEYNNNIEGYYRTLYSRLREDGYVEQLRGILLQVMYGVRNNDVRLFDECGYLSENEHGYYILSQDFTDYFMEKSKDLYLPAWDSIMASERTLKNMVRRVYPRLDDFRYSELSRDRAWRQRVSEIYPEICLNEEMILKNMANGTNYGQNPTITDVLGLKYTVFNIIKSNWEKFQGYFRGEPYDNWQKQLELLVRARTPLAHDHADYLTENEEQLLLMYCKQFMELNRS